MTFKAKCLLLGAPLLTLSGLSAADPQTEGSRAGLIDPVIVTGANSTDGQIRAEVLRRIDGTAALATDSIGVQSIDHNVYLFGWVTNRIDSEAAEAIARTVPGVKHIYNGLGTIGA